MKICHWTVAEGSPIPLGATWLAAEKAFNFALSSTNAEYVLLLLYEEDDLVHPARTYRLNYLTNKSNNVWHCRVPENEIANVKYYAYSVFGPANEANSTAGHAFDSDKILLDPYAKVIFFSKDFDRQSAIDPGSNGGKAPLGVLLKEQPFEDKPFCSLYPEYPDPIIYELHVRGFTKNENSGVSKTSRGTFKGIIEKIPYLKELGITAIELMPIFQFDPQDGNYWGYMPVSFFSLHHGYSESSDPIEQRNEFRSMVEALHNADIRVILDVVYNHTAEGDYRGPTYNLRGIDNCTYYLLAQDDSGAYINYSGTGNALNVSNMEARRLIVDSLKYWVREMHVDGFRYDLASVLVRNPDGSINPNPPILDHLGASPELAKVLHIAEPWDVEAGGYLLGTSFPAAVAWQWNDRFRDNVRSFLKGDPGLVGSLMTRLYGSDDLFPDNIMHCYHPFQSVNYIASHDGYTLYDLVSYSKKNNWANNHNNEDGANEFNSFNCGWEGDENVPTEVMLLRKKQVKNFCCILLLSNGTPMFRAGDEFLQTQAGNSNPYNQDNKTSWLNWDRLKEHHDIFRFFKEMISFRKSHPSIARSRFWRADVRWYGVNEHADLSYESHTLSYFLSGAQYEDDDLYVMINADFKPIDFTIQEHGPWLRVVDTNASSPDDVKDAGKEHPLSSNLYSMAAHSIVVLLRKKLR